MRISSEQIEFLKKEILAQMPGALIYIFGSRVYDNKKGGDIDVMILSDKKLNWKKKAKIKWLFFDKFGEQRLDIVSFTHKEEDPFKRIILLEGEVL